MTAKEIDEAIARGFQRLGHCNVEPSQHRDYQYVEDLYRAANELKRRLIEAGEALSPLAGLDIESIKGLGRNAPISQVGETYVTEAHVLCARKIAARIKLGFVEN